MLDKKNNKYKNYNKGYKPKNNKNVSLDYSELVFNKADMYNVLRDYKSYYYDSNRGRTYSKEQVRKFLENPQQYERQIRELSLYLASTSSYYIRLINYLSSMLTLDHMVTPTKFDMPKERMLSLYNRCVSYVDEFNIKHELGKIIPTILIEDTFFGYESRANGKSTIRKLPHNYCKIVGIEDGIYIFAFNFSYFSGKEHLLRDYPREFKNLHNRYKQTGKPWQELNPNMGAICFKFRDDLTYSVPYFTPLFEEIVELEEKKDAVSEAEELGNFKLLVQKIPMKTDPKSEKDYVLTLPTVTKFHNNIKTALPNGVALISTPMDIEDYSFDVSGSADTSDISDAQSNLTTSAGFGNIFQADNKSATGLKYANISDQSMMFKLLRQFERFFNGRIKHIFGKDCGMRLLFLDITHFNRTDKINEYLKLAQYGLPKSTVIVASGISQSEFLGLNALEQHLNLEQILVPLNSSHTQNGNSESSKDADAPERGHPTSEEEEQNRKDNLESEGATTE